MTGRGEANRVSLSRLAEPEKEARTVALAVGAERRGAAGQAERLVGVLGHAEYETTFRERGERGSECIS